MSANPKVGVGAQVKEILEGAKANSAVREDGWTERRNTGNTGGTLTARWQRWYDLTERK